MCIRDRALELHGDRARLPRADPDGKVAIAPQLAQDDDVLGREHVDSHALDGHLDQAADHGWIIPPRGGGAGASYGLGVGRGWADGFGVTAGAPDGPGPADPPEEELAPGELPGDAPAVTPKP